MEWLAGLVETLGAWAIVIPFLIGIGLALAVVQVVPPQHIPTVTRGLKVVGTAAAGVAIGATVGGPVGAVVGGLVGAAIGFFW